MEMDEDDDIYVPEEPQEEHNQTQQPTTTKATEELEEGEEEDEGGAMDEDDDDSDIDIITERKDGTKAAPPTQAKYSDIRNIPQRSSTNDSPGKPPAALPVTQPEAAASTSNTLHIAVPSADQSSAAASSSTVDINANPVYAQVGKPITQVNIDEDLPDNEKPWRKPGTDITDYFNYGFDEFTWALYAAKQESVRGEFGADAFAVNNKKMMEDFNMMMMGGGGGMGMGGGDATRDGAEDAADDVLRDFAVPLVGHLLVDEALDEAGDALRGPVVGLVFRHLVNVNGDGEENAAPGGENVGAVWTSPDALKQKVGHDAIFNWKKERVKK
ncbi:hypothetical protein NQ176_g5029 [Zarea fungicola]|uniref:Uncharacterized protein n=1 Tax=Zarea fungicola TaxID=93591 RepID=A0ACC1NCV0_9HYPO|nr:hypothetical protein NQ176_g5029 [Lecanicillium fungicola]